MTYDMAVSIAVATIQSRLDYANSTRYGISLEIWGVDVSSSVGMLLGRIDIWIAVTVTVISGYEKERLNKIIY